MSAKKDSGTLLEELDELYKDIQTKLQKASFLGKNMADKFIPIDRLICFVGKVVKKVERLEKENKFLKDELGLINRELALQNTVIKQFASKGKNKDSK